MFDLTFPMRDALATLLTEDAELGGDHWRQTFRTPTGRVIAGQTIKALSKRALGRPSGPNRTAFTLTAAGRRLAASLTNANAA